MKHRLFTVMSAASLLLCAAAISLWARSYHVQDVIVWRRPATAAPRAAWLFIFDKGTLIAGKWESPQQFLGVSAFQGSSGYLSPYHDYSKAPALFHESLYPMNFIGPRLSFGGFGLIIGGPIVFLPLWFLAVCAGVLPGWWLAWRRRLRARLVAGCCSGCGYDLRASSGRCPECGNPITQKIHATR